MREWTVAGGLIVGPEGLLLVRNRRRWGGHDWSPPGGVIDAEDDGVLAGLTREVREETGLTVVSWEGLLYEVSAVAHDLGWHLRALVYLADDYEGEVAPDDPDGIVDRAAFADRDACAELLGDGHRWVREPLGEWLAERWRPGHRRTYRYSVYGTDVQSLRVEREA